MERRMFKRGAVFAALLLVAALALGVAPSVFADDTAGNKSAATDAQLKAKAERIRTSRVTQEEREIAAARMKLMKDSAQSAASSKRSLAAVAPAPGPGGIPDYFGSTPNWAFSPLSAQVRGRAAGLGPREQEQPRASTCRLPSPTPRHTPALTTTRSSCASTRSSCTLTCLRRCFAAMSRSTRGPTRTVTTPSNRIPSTTSVRRSSPPRTVRCA